VRCSHASNITLFVVNAFTRIVPIQIFSLEIMIVGAVSMLGGFDSVPGGSDARQGPREPSDSNDDSLCTLRSVSIEVDAPLHLRCSPPDGVNLTVNPSCQLYQFSLDLGRSRQKNAFLGLGQFRPRLRGLREQAVQPGRFQVPPQGVRASKGLGYVNPC
jgi:hypothetical protein